MAKYNLTVLAAFPLTIKLSRKEEKKVGQILNELGSSVSPAEMVQFIKDAIRSRESVKFEFTKNLSKALDLCVELGQAY